jgi:hypothetical protein
VEQLLKGWDDQRDAEICEMLSTLSVDRAFVEENRHTYFAKNVYDSVKPRLELELVKARNAGDQARIAAICEVLALFEQAREHLRQITEYRTIIAHMDRCGRHG